MKRWSIGLVAACSLMGTLAGAEPIHPGSESLERVPSEGSRFELKAHPRGERIAGSVYASVKKDGTHIETMGTFRIGDPPLYYHFEIDLKTKTYTATKKEVPSEWLKGQQGRKGPDSTTTAISPGHWYVEARLITEDIPQIDLATTVNYVSWYVYSNGSMAISNAYGSCTPYNGTGQPYPVDTHWYVQTGSCQRYSNYSPWAQRVTGGYYNWDWGYDDRATTAYHEVILQPNNNATFSYWSDYIHEGEDSYALQADLFLNGYQEY